MWRFLPLLILYVRRIQSRPCDWGTEDSCVNHMTAGCIWNGLVDNAYCVSADCFYDTEDLCKNHGGGPTCYWESSMGQCYSERWWSAAYSMEEEDTDNGQMTSGGVTVIVVCIALLCGMVVALSLWRRRQSAKSKTSSDVEIQRGVYTPPAVTNVNENGNSNTEVIVVNVQ